MQAVRTAAEGPDDAAICEGVIRGDNQAITTLYRTYARYVAAIALRLLGDDGDLDDIVQETFLAATRDMSSLRDPSSLRTWLATIAVRRTQRRLAARRRRHLVASIARAFLPRASDPSHRGHVDSLFEALDTLPEDLRVPWTLHRMVGETLPEVARITGVSLATVTRRVASAEEKLRRRLDA